MAADCKSAGVNLRWFESNRLHHISFPASAIHSAAGKDAKSGSQFSLRASPTRSFPGRPRGDQNRQIRGSNSGVESQPSKLLVAGSNPVSRSTIFTGWSPADGEANRIWTRLDPFASLRKLVFCRGPSFQPPPGALIRTQAVQLRTRQDHGRRFFTDSRNQNTTKLARSGGIRPRDSLATGEHQISRAHVAQR